MIYNVVLILGVQQNDLVIYIIYSYYIYLYIIYMDFPGGARVKNLAASAGDTETWV